MKKVLAVFVSFLVMLSLLVGCGVESTGNSRLTISVKDGVDSSEIEEKIGEDYLSSTLIKSVDQILIEIGVMDSRLPKSYQFNLTSEDYANLTFTVEDKEISVMCFLRDPMFVNEDDDPIEWWNIGTISRADDAYHIYWTGTDMSDQEDFKYFDIITDEEISYNQIFKIN